MKPFPELVLSDFQEVVRSLEQQAYAVIDGFLSSSETTQLRQSAEVLFQAGDFSPAGIGRQTSYQQDRCVRSDLIRWLDKDSAGATIFFDRIDQLILLLNRTCFLGIRDFEVHFAVYPAGSFYQRHLDNFRDSSSRVLSVICYLNDTWQPAHGGQLRLYLQEDAGERALDIAPLGGRLVIFDSRSIEHEVLVAHRIRYSITGWLRNQSALF